MKLQIKRPRPRVVRGVTLLEMAIVIGILSFLVAIGVVHLRNTRSTTTDLASDISFHMKFLRATTQLQESLQTGSEIVKPVAGRTLPYLIFRDINLHTQILYLEKTDIEGEKPAVLVNYTDVYDGKYDQARKKVLFGGVKNIEFTANTPGLVLVNIALTSPREKEITSIIEIPFKNFGTVEGE